MGHTSPTPPTPTIPSPTLTAPTNPARTPRTHGMAVAFGPASEPDGHSGVAGSELPSARLSLVENPSELALQLRLWREIQFAPQIVARKGWARRLLALAIGASGAHAGIGASGVWGRQRPASWTLPWSSPYQGWGFSVAQSNCFLHLHQENVQDRGPHRVCVGTSPTFS